MRYLFFSHDGFGLGHLRRNSLIAQAVLTIDPSAEVVLLTGVPWHPLWLDRARFTVVRMRPLLKHADGGYRSEGISFEAAVAERARTFADCVHWFEPSVVVVDRHPYGTAGELRSGIELARARGARLVLGLRDVLDDPAVVRSELTGDGWSGAMDVYDEVLVYGARHFCDHEVEYGLPRRPRYCGWVTEAGHPRPESPRLLAVTAGGGGDGGELFRLAFGVLEHRPTWRATFAVGPYADSGALDAHLTASPARDRVEVRAEVEGCAPLFCEASAALQMAGYNSTFEALAAGQRAVLAPRRRPRAEQAIRAERLAQLDLADVVPEGADPAEVHLLLDRPRRMSRERVERSGIALDGAVRAAAALVEHAALVRT